MSECIKDGLYHPNCQDSHATYFGDIDDEENEEEEPEEQEQTEEEPAETEFEEDEVGQGEGTEEAEEITEPITPEEQRRNIELYNAEQRQNYCERQVERFERMSKYSLDEDNQRIYRARKNEWKEKLAQIKNDLKSLISTKRIQNVEKMAVHFPKGFVDTRQIGEKISEENLQKFVDNAKEMNITFGNVKNSKYGGFDKYCGDPDVLFDMLEHLKENQKILTELSGSDKIILEYDYLREGGAIDIGTFACTKGKTITFNKFMYDDSNYLKSEYSEAVRLGKFAKGTTYKNVPDHECGHLFARNNKLYLSGLRRVCERKAAELGITSNQFIVENISSYADYLNELPAEINSMKYGSQPDLALEILKEAGLK